MPNQKNNGLFGRKLLRACLDATSRRVRARGLQETAGICSSCRPGAPTGRISKHALSLAFYVIGLVSLSGVFRAQAYPDLQGAYAALGFNPSAPGNAVVVFFSDAHMNLDIIGMPAPVVTTNIDYRLLSTVNAMDPPPNMIVIAGDESSSLSPAPGIDGLVYPVAVMRATNEMALFAAEIKKITNVAPDQIVWIPGNHDQSPRETDAETWSRMFPQMPTYQAFYVNGVKFFLVNSGNYGEPSDSEQAWLRQEVARTSPTQEVAVVTHQPPFHGSVVHRGVAHLLRDVFGDWQNRWWVFDGHEHAPSVEVYNVGRSNVTQVTVAAASTNTFIGYTRDIGYMVLCISNGISGMIYYHYATEDFVALPTPDWGNPRPFVGPFEETPGLLWRRMKTTDFAPELLVSNSGNAMDWWSYVQELQWELGLERHQNLATHFVLLVSGMSLNATVELGLDRTNWVEVARPTPTNDVYWYAIPSEMRTAPRIYARYQSAGAANNWIAGWGLATTNDVTLVTYPQLTGVPDATVGLGHILRVTNVVNDPYAPPDRLHFSLINGPEGASVDPNTGVFQWQPSLGSLGSTVQVEILVADNYWTPMIDTKSFSITVTNCDGTQIAAPTGLVASKQTHCGYTEIEWQEVENAEIYELFRDGVLLGTTAAPVFIDYAQDVTSHSYSVRAKNSCSVSALSEPDSGKTAFSTIQLASEPPEAGVVMGGGAAICGSVATVHAQSSNSTEYVFANWSEGGEVVSMSDSYSFVVNSNRNLTANFSAEPAVVDVTSSIAAAGAVSGGGKYVSGQVARLSALLTNHCFNFVGWREGEQLVSETPEYSFIVTNSRSLSAAFQPVQYIIDSAASPACAGTVSGGGPHDCEGQVVLSAEPRPGYTFLYWSEDSVPVSTASNYTFTATTNRKFLAEFSGSLLTFADFSASVIVVENMQVTSTNGASPDEGAGQWLLPARDANLALSFEACPGVDYELWITHRTSPATGCPGAGYSPVTLSLNSANLLWNYDPAQHHQGAKDFVTDVMRITALEGLNTITLTAGPLCSPYEIRRIEIRPVKKNDLFADAARLTGSAITAVARNVNAGREAGEPLHAGKPGGCSVWWEWIAPASGTATVSTAGSSFDTLLAVYTGGITDEFMLQPVAANNDEAANLKTSRLVFAATEGVPYFIAVDGYKGAVGTVRLQLNLPSPNDDFGDRIALYNARESVTGFNDNAGKEPGEPNHAGLPGGRSVWWSWTAPASGTVQISTTGSAFDTVLAIYTGASLSSLVPVASCDNQDAERGLFDALVTAEVVAGTQYQIAVDSAVEAVSGTIALNIVLRSTEPYLFFQRIGDQMTIFWGAEWRDYVLESRSTDSDLWTVLSDSPPFTNSTTGEALFYRLRRLR